MRAHHRAGCQALEHGIHLALQHCNGILCWRLWQLSLVLQAAQDSMIKPSERVLAEETDCMQGKGQAGPHLPGVQLYVLLSAGHGLLGGDEAIACMAMPHFHHISSSPDLWHILQAAG
jgi:hypothetical protein